MDLSKVATKLIGDKKRWRAYKARVKNLPENYRIAVEAVERYLMYFGGVADGDSAARMFEDLADLFEMAAEDHKPIREIVGDDPVEFIDAFLANYDQGGWVNKERTRLINSIAEACAGDPQ